LTFLRLRTLFLEGFRTLIPQPGTRCPPGAGPSSEALVAARLPPVVVGTRTALHPPQVVADSSVSTRILTPPEFANHAEKCDRSLSKCRKYGSFLFLYFSDLSYEYKINVDIPCTNDIYGVSLIFLS